MSIGKRIPNRGLIPVAASAALLSLLLAACAAEASATSSAPPAASGLVADVKDRPVVIIDESGKNLGQGTVNLYAPTSMNLNEASKIRLEIDGKGIISQGLSPTVATTPGATPSAKERLSIHQIMGATLQGADTFHFAINPVPSNGMRNIDTKSVTWWEWNLRAVGPGSVGTNSLELFVYYPHKTNTGTELNQEVVTFPISIEVVGPPTPTPSVFDQVYDSIGPVARVAGAITAIAGAIGVIYGAYRFMMRRRRISKSRHH